jgi:hypothetical protein
MQKWEYKVVVTFREHIARIDGGELLTDRQSIHAFLQMLGEQGWELVSVDCDESSTYYFKTP